MIIAMKTTRKTTSLVLNSFSSTVDISFPSVRLFKSKATITTANNASGIAMSRVGIESRIISDSFIRLAKNKKTPLPTASKKRPDECHTLKNSYRNKQTHDPITSKILEHH